MSLQTISILNRASCLKKLSANSPAPSSRSADRYFYQSAANSVLGFIGTEFRPFDTYEEWFACLGGSLEEQSSSGTGSEAQFPLPGTGRFGGRKRRQSMELRHTSGNARAAGEEHVDERRGAAAEAPRTRAFNFRRRQRAADRRNWRKRDLFENAVPASLTPGDYRRLQSAPN